MRKSSIVTIDLSPRQNLTELVTGLPEPIERVIESRAEADTTRMSENGVFLIVHTPPETVPPNRRKGYPWRELGVGEGFFVPGRQGDNLKVTALVKGCEGRIFRTYRGESKGVRGRWAKRVK